MILELGEHCRAHQPLKRHQFEDYPWYPISKPPKWPDSTEAKNSLLLFFLKKNIGFVNSDAPFSHLHTSLYIFDIVYGCTSKFEGKTNSQALGGPLSSAKVQGHSQTALLLVTGSLAWVQRKLIGNLVFCFKYRGSAHFLWNQIWKCRNSGYLCGVEFHSFVINKYQQPVARVIQQQSKVLWCTSTASSDSSTRLRKKKRGPETNWQALCEVSEEFGCWVRNPFYKFTINRMGTYSFSVADTVTLANLAITGTWNHLARTKEQKEHDLLSN